MLQGLDMSSKLGHVYCTNQVLQKSEPILSDRECSTLEAGASLLDLSNKGRSAIAIKEL